MSTRLSTIATSAWLRNYSQGAALSNVGKLAQFLAPTVNVSSPRFRYWKYDDQNRFKIIDTRRALHGGAKQYFMGGVEQSGELEAHALDYPIDEVEQMADDTLQNTAKEGADETAHVFGLAHEKEVVDKALTAVGPGTDINVASSSVDVVDEFDKAIINLTKTAKLSSMHPIRMLFGPNALRLLKNCESVRGRFKRGKGEQGGVAPAVSDLLSLLIGDPEAMMTLSIYDSAQEGLTPNVDFMIDNSVLIFVGSNNPTRRDPSFMKTFRIRDSYMTPGTYRSQDGRVEFLKFDDLRLVAVTNSAACVRLNLKTT